jgi:hypothetical protein
MIEPSLATELVLPKSGLRVRDGKFVRFAADGAVVAEVALHDVKDVVVHRPLDPVAIVIGAIAFAGVAAALRFAEAGWLRWTGVVLGGLVGLVCMVAQRKNQIRVITRGDVLRFDFTDTPEDANAFSYSVRERARESRARAG